MTSFDATVEASVRDVWRIGNAAVTAHFGGMNSRTWLVKAGERRWVAKAVPAGTNPHFASALEVAEIVDDAGIPAGRPLRTADGRSCIAVEEHMLALLRFVPGRPLTADTPRARRMLGSTLARVHRALRGRRPTSVEHFHWLDPEAAHLDIEPWVRQGVREAIAAYDGLPPRSLTWGLLHTDPAPEAFRFDARTATCGLIDWDTAIEGPLLYDLASAVMYVGGLRRATELNDAYLAERVIDPSEIPRALVPMLRLRWAVQADYFARRIAAHDFTGIGGHEENVKGLEDARRALGF